MDLITTRSLTLDGPLAGDAPAAWAAAAAHDHDLHYTVPADLAPSAHALDWHCGSALKDVEAVLEGVRWSGGPGRVVVQLGEPNEWAACGVVRLEIARAPDAIDLRLDWDDGREVVKLRAARIPGPPERLERVELATSERPAGAWRVRSDNAWAARGLLGEALPFRPYAITPRRVLVALEGAVEVGRVSVKVGAAAAPLVAFGDSQVHQGRTLEHLAHHGLRRWINAGQAGGDTAGGLARLGSDLLALRPTHALLWLGSNDLGHARRRGDPIEPAMAQALDRLATIIREAADAGIAPVVIGGLPRGGEAVMREFNARLGLVAARSGAAWFDPYEVLHRRHDKQDIRWSDGLHPNDEGARRLAAWLAGEGLVEALGGRRVDPPPAGPAGAGR